MIHCYVALCLVANPSICKPPVEIVPSDGHVITSPMECSRGGFVFFTQGRMQQQTPGSPEPKWFAKTLSRLEGDGSDIVRKWVEDEKARAARMEPQIK